MLRRSSTIWLPRIALALLMLLVSHDVVMATDPHNVEGAATHGDHAPAHNAPRTDAASHVQTATCMAIEAARTSESIRVDGDLPSNVVVDSRCQVADSRAVAIDHDEAGGSPGQLRAMLQVYLN
ncbi:MAG: hypothetical protein H0U38_01650 [Chloroflexia bacterium]|nr:hypothetical protein [Chloroflexia bacterium]